MNSFFDSHCHLNFPVFDKERDLILKKCFQKNVSLLLVGTNYLNSQEAVFLAQEHKMLIAAVGLHPLNLADNFFQRRDSWEGGEKEFFSRGKYKKLASFPSVVAIGEIGLDYYYQPKGKRKRKVFREKQKELLFEELSLAKDLSLPVVFHCRMAHDDLISFLKENEKIRPEKAVFHSFSGTLEDLKKVLDFGYYVGLNGLIFKKIEGINFEEIIKYLPLERMLLETDSPYLSPPSFPERINTPCSIPLIAQRIGKIKGISPQKIIDWTRKNGKKLFLSKK